MDRFVPQFDLYLNRQNISVYLYGFFTPSFTKTTEMPAHIFVDIEQYFNCVCYFGQNVIYTLQKTGDLNTQASTLSRV